MMVRLAFAVMVEADADIMLVDEVLAVGDAAFAQKCMDVFHERRRAGRTLVLVTHDMATVEGICDRAMLLEAGEMRLRWATRRRPRCEYFRVNFARGLEPEPDPTRRRVGRQRRRASMRGSRTPPASAVDSVEQGEPIALRLVLEARATSSAPVVRHPLRRRARERPCSASTAR